MEDLCHFQNWIAVKASAAEQQPPSKCKIHVFRHRCAENFSIYLLEEIYDYLPKNGGKCRLDASFSTNTGVLISSVGYRAERIYFSARSMKFMRPEVWITLSLYFFATGGVSKWTRTWPERRLHIIHIVFVCDFCAGTYIDCGCRIYL